MQNTWLENRIHKWHYDHLEGGGGVERYTTAKIKFTNVENIGLYAYGAFMAEHGPQGSPVTFGNIRIDPNTADYDVDIILLDGAALLIVDTDMSTLSITGDITYDSTNQFFIVTGNGTISNIS